MKRALLAGLVAAALVLAIGAAWVSRAHNRDLEHRLGEAARRTAALEQKTREQARELARTLAEASASQHRAELSQAQAIEAAAATSTALEKSRVLDQARQLAEENARQSRMELAAFRERREQELKRMQEALARIASTRRTNTGFVIDLTNDSFYFDFDKAVLRPENREILSRIAGVLLVSNGYRLFVHGHTDDVGSPDYNQQLSERRAESVADYLVSAGIDKGVIETRGFGASSPRTAGKSTEERQKNRRVEIVVVDSVIQYQGEVSRAGFGR